mmetsp:Transcript_49717/g.89368  ORF Transcript_49717/g.89368 Transcript_49717/m.89368 type:complete len:407 (-) Transcript_49717:35-1255(-)
MGVVTSLCQDPHHFPARGRDDLPPADLVWDGARIGRSKAPAMLAAAPAPLNAPGAGIFSKATPSASSSQPGFNARGASPAPSRGPAYLPQEPESAGPTMTNLPSEGVVEGVLVGGPRKSDGHRHQGDPRIRKLRQEVAETNYKLRNRWAVPVTVYVPCDQCLRAHAQAAPVARKPPKVTFSGWSTADALLHFARLPKKLVCGLNFANGSQVGGGYKTGALAQEEDLCRRLPNLYTTLNNAQRDGLYPFGPSTCYSEDKPAKYSDVLFTPDLVVARMSEEEQFKLLPQEEQVKVSLVTAAAPNINFAKEVYNLKLMYDTVKAMFVVPKLMRPETTTLILGAWGCGAFGGDPHDMSDLFARAIATDGLGQMYEDIHFAIPQSDASESNADVFRTTFWKYGIQFEELGK